jgi:hypothetical protein
VRLGVVDRRVVVDVALAVGQVQPVQRALGALAVEHRASTSLRTSRPPSENECDEKLALRTDARACCRRGTPPGSPPGPCSDPSRRDRRATTSVTALVKYTLAGGPT